MCKLCIYRIRNKSWVIIAVIMHVACILELLYHIIFKFFEIPKINQFSLLLAESCLICIGGKLSLKSTHELGHTYLNSCRSDFCIDIWVGRP